MNLLNIIAPYKVIIPAHTIDPDHNATFEVAEQVKRFRTPERVNKYLDSWEERSKHVVRYTNMHLVRPEDLPEKPLAEVKFQQGVTEGNITYALITLFAGDYMAESAYAQNYTATIAGQYKDKFSQLVN